MSDRLRDLSIDSLVACLLRRVHGTVVAGATLIVCALGIACANPTGAEPHSLQLESISYDAVGGGVVVFERFEEVDYGLLLVDGSARTTQVILHDGRARGAVISPDGKRLAFSRLANNLNYDIAMLDLPSHTEMRLTTETSFHGMPTWTPNGQEIVYPSTVLSPNTLLFDYLILSVSAAGATGRRNFTSFDVAERLRCPYGEFATPAFMSSRSELAMKCGGRVYTKTENAAPVLLESIGAPDTVVAFAWSPDGERLAYTDFYNGQYRVSMASRDGRNASTIATLSSAPSNWALFNRSSICWTHDGTRLFFNVTNGNASSHVWAVHPDGSGLTQLTTKTGAFDHNVSCT